MRPADPDADPDTGPDADLDAVAARARVGDADALAELWRAYNPPLLRYLRGRGAPAADDLAAEVWVEVATHVARAEDGAAGFRRLLFTVARHRLIDDFRRADRSREVLCEPPEELSEADPEASALARDGLAQALQLVRRLPPDQAEALLLRVLGGFDVAETAEIMGRPPGTVRVLMHRAIRALRMELVTEPRVRSEMEVS